MSAPHRYTKDAENLKYGFLAARSRESINKILAGTHLNETEQETLESAREFLNTVADGVEFVSTGHSRGHNSMESVYVLDYIMDPLSNLNLVRQDEDISTYLTQLSNSFANAVSKAESLSDEDKENLKEAEDFFDAMYKSLLTAMSTNRKESNKFSKYAIS